MQEPINQLHETLINIMVISDTTSFEERYTYLEHVINKNFDIALISKVILGRYWKSIDDEIKVRFINLLNRLTISTYISRFNSYDNQIFKNISIEQLKENRHLVKTEFVRLKEKPISFNYIIQKNGKKWRIISVIANGINDLSLKRAEYAAIIKKDGINTLIGKLEQKIYDLQSN
jgi:phospholipid transport system substrate-binding protein